MKRSRLPLLLAFLTLSGALYLSAGDQGPTSGSGTDDHLRRVRVADVAAQTSARTLRFTGVLRATRRARLAFTLGGRLSTRPVEVGDRVERGDELARLDDRELRHAVARADASLRELQASLAQRTRDVARVSALVDAKAATSEELEQVSAGLDSLRAAEEAATAALREQRRLLDETRLRAPFAGMITSVLAEPGESTTSGRTVVVLSGSGALEVEVEVPEQVMVRLENGAAVRVDLPALGILDLAGETTSVGRTAAGPGQLFPVVVAVDAPARAGAGMTAEVALRLQEDQVLTLPIEAVTNPGGQRPSVFRLVERDGRTVVEKLAVRVGTLIGGRVSIEGALAEGDRVVVGGQRGLLDGDAVEVMP